MWMSPVQYGTNTWVQSWVSTFGSPTSMWAASMRVSSGDRNDDLMLWLAVPFM